MLQAVVLGSSPGRGRGKFYRIKRFVDNRHSQGIKMNRGEQENLFRQSRQLTRIVPSREDLVLSVLKAPINQQQHQHHQHQHQHQHQQHHPQNFPNSPQQQQHTSFQHHHANCQAHENYKKCNNPGIVETEALYAEPRESRFNDPRRRCNVRERLKRLIIVFRMKDVWKKGCNLEREDKKKLPQFRERSYEKLLNETLIEKKFHSCGWSCFITVIK